MLHDRDIAKTCCGNRYLRKQSPTDVCCGGRFYTRTTNYQCCYSNYQLVQAGQVCCQDNRDTIHVGDGNTCCDGIPYYNNTKYCVCGALYNDNSRKCCGGQVVSQVQVCCGDTVSGRVYSEDSQKKCCGNNYVPLSSLCCQSNTGDWKVGFLKHVVLQFVNCPVHLPIISSRSLKTGCKSWLSTVLNNIVEPGSDATMPDNTIDNYEQ